MRTVGITTHRPLVGHDQHLVGVTVRWVAPEPGREKRMRKTWCYRIPVKEAQEALRQISTIERTVESEHTEIH